MTSEIEALFARYEQAQWLGAFAYRERLQLPFDSSTLSAEGPILFDTTVYVDNLAGHLPPQIAALIASRVVYHATPSLAEFAFPVGYLNPTDPRTQGSVRAILRVIGRILPERILAPVPEHWLEASLIAGTLARTQTIPKPDRRKFMNDILIYLVAGDLGATVLTRNTRDFDLLLQIRPGVGVLFYDRA